jgi:2-polyprenyl-3-methyl-5-hydroxy-6-metoxy-1,4-benzoquinol methylase
MQTIGIIRNKIRSIFDPEIRAIRAIIKDAYPSLSDKSLSVEICDEVFIQRLTRNPEALKMSFWENHFEWRSLGDYPQIQGRLIDFGCGSGHLDVMLARNGWTVHGIDLSPIGIRIANYLKSKEDKLVQARLSFDAMDISRGRADGLIYDSAWSAHVFEHIADPAPVLKGLHNWLKPGAYLLISVPLGNAYDDPGHVNHFFSTQELATYLNGKVTIERMDVSSEYQVIRALCKIA